MITQERDRRYVRQLILDARQAGIRAAEASKRWRAMNQALSEKLAADGITDPVVVSRTFQVNVELNDAMSSWSWWEREQKRLESLLAVEYYGHSLLDRPTPPAP